MKLLHPVLKRHQARLDAARDAGVALSLEPPQREEHLLARASVEHGGRHHGGGLGVVGDDADGVPVAQATDHAAGGASAWLATLGRVVAESAEAV